MCRHARAGMSGCCICVALFATSAVAASGDVAPLASFTRQMQGPAWVAAMRAAGVLKPLPAPRSLTQIARDPPPPASLFFGSQLFGDPDHPHHFDKDLSKLEPPSKSFEAPPPQAESAAPVPLPPVAARTPPLPPVRNAQEEHQKKPLEQAAKRHAPDKTRAAARKSEHAHEVARSKSATHEAKAEEGHPHLKTGRSVAMHVHRPVLVHPSSRGRRAVARPHGPAQPRVPVVALPSALLPTRP